MLDQNGVNIVRKLYEGATHYTPDYGDEVFSFQACTFSIKMQAKFYENNEIQMRTFCFFSHLGTFLDRNKCLHLFVGVCVVHTVIPASFIERFENFALLKLGRNINKMCIIITTVVSSRMCMK